MLGEDLGQGQDKEKQDAAGKSGSTQLETVINSKIVKYTDEWMISGR